MLALALRALASLPPSIQRALAGGGRVRIDGQELDPAVQLSLGLLGRFGRLDIENLPPDEARQETRRESRLVAGRPIPLARVEDVDLGGVPGRLYAPRRDGRGAGLVYLHGGGWVVGGLDTHDAVCSFLADAAGVTVVAADYRLAPEHRFPAAVEDALAAFRHLAGAAASLGLDPERIAVGGDSAGGNLSAVVARLATAAGGPAPAFQLLIYPVTDLSEKRRSYRLFRDGYYLTERQMDWYRGHYLPDGEAALDPRASPLLAEDLTGLPPAYVTTAGFDPLRDEGEAYAERMREAGVRVTLRRHEGLVHGFANVVGMGPRLQGPMLEAAATLRAAFA